MAASAYAAVKKRMMVEIKWRRLFGKMRRYKKMTEALMLKVIGRYMALEATSVLFKMLKSYMCSTTMTISWRPIPRAAREASKPTPIVVKICLGTCQRLRLFEISGLLK